MADVVQRHSRRVAAYVLVLRRWQTRTHCSGNIVTHDVSLHAQTGKHLLRTQNASEQNQKHFCVPDTKYVSTTNVARAGKRGNICVGSNVSGTMCPRLPVPLCYVNRRRRNRERWKNRLNIWTKPYISRNPSLGAYSHSCSFFVCLLFGVFVCFVNSSMNRNVASRPSSEVRAILEGVTQIT